MQAGKAASRREVKIGEGGKREGEEISKSNEKFHTTMDIQHAPKESRKRREVKEKKKCLSVCKQTGQTHGTPPAFPSFSLFLSLLEGAVNSDSRSSSQKRKFKGEKKKSIQRETRLGSL
mmetsp:Transcript_49544/g.97556  ORF Transcript_49544/g.97556 Transcript_49544/m.97556 type:complete len:119 (-) Transcript_49544:1231-1587(-)